MGTTADGGRGSEGRAANGDRPVGAARCRREQHTQGVMPAPPPLKTQQVTATLLHRITATSTDLWKPFLSSTKALLQSTSKSPVHLQSTCRYGPVRPSGQGRGTLPHHLPPAPHPPPPPQDRGEWGSEVNLLQFFAISRNVQQFSRKCLLPVPLACVLGPCVSPVQRCCSGFGGLGYGTAIFLPFIRNFSQFSRNFSQFFAIRFDAAGAQPPPPPGSGPVAQLS